MAQIVFHPAHLRGSADHGWLKTRHSFSFAQYFDPQRIHFGALRVLNDDFLIGGTGFSMHPHDNMEIVTILLNGDLRHRDNTGRDQIIRTGDVQIMSAGAGIRHSEFNANPHLPVELLQIWIFPKIRNIQPRYQQQTFSILNQPNQLQTVVSPKNDALNALWINQDAFLSIGYFEPQNLLTYQIQAHQNGLYAFVISGNATIHGQQAAARDAVGIWNTSTIDIQFNEPTYLLLIDIPMNINL